MAALGSFNTFVSNTTADPTKVNENFNTITSAFGTSGHSHDGTAGNGPQLDPTTALTYTPADLTGDDFTGKVSITPAAVSGFQEGLRLVDSAGGAGEGVYIRWDALSKTDQARLGLDTKATGSDLVGYTNSADSGTPTESFRSKANGDFDVAGTIIGGALDQTSFFSQSDINDGSNVTLPAGWSSAYLIPVIKSIPAVSSKYFQAVSVTAAQVITGNTAITCRATVNNVAGDSSSTAAGTASCFLIRLS